MRAPLRAQFFALLVPLSAVFVLSGGIRSAQAADEDDPFAGENPPGSPAKPAADTTPRPGTPGPQVQGPPAAPEEAAPAKPAIVQELPASGYPEPYPRGLYGGPLWLDMQGLQWPYTPQTGISLSGYGWIDTMYKYVRIGDPSQLPHASTLFQQGRVLFRVTPTYSSGLWFAQAQAEFVANKDQIDAQANGLVDADDVWVRTGYWQQWDVTFGRFQAFDVYPLGMGLDLNSDERTGAYDTSNTTPVALYAGDFMLYRPAGPGNVAVHLYPIKPLRFELLGQWGSAGGATPGLNLVGGRPAAIFDIGWLKVRGALEYQYGFSNQSTTGSQHTLKHRGGAGSVQLVFLPYIELGANVGYAVLDEADTAHGPFQENLDKSGNKYSYGGFVDAAPVPDLLIGGGVNYTYFHSLDIPSGETAYEHFTNLQTYAAAQYLVRRQLFVKVVAGYAKSHFENIATGAGYDDDQFSVRLRVMYLY